MFSCSVDIEFDKDKWNEKTDLFYKYRRQMITDLVEKRLNSKMTKKEITELLGHSSNDGDTTKRKDLAFEIYEDYGWDIDPVETQYLTITLDNDSTLDKVYLETWKHFKGIEKKEFVIK